MMFVDLGSALGSHHAGRARIVAIADKVRDPSIPDVPTLSEAGVPEFQSITWFSLAAPPGTPSAIINKLNKTIVEGMLTDEVQARYKALHYRESKATPEEIAAFMKSERKVWGDVIRAAKISLE